MRVFSQPGPVSAAARLLHAGGLVAFPTETVYGLGAEATNPRAVAQVFALKGRPADHPLIVHLAPPAAPAGPASPSAEAWSGLLGRWAQDVPATAVTLAWLFWPGPLTLILRKQPWVPAEVTGGQDTVGLRVPAHPVALALLVGLGELAEAGAPCGIAAPSANRFGSLSPTTAQDVLEAWPGMLCPAADLAADGALPAGVAGCVLDGGACQVGLESTIVDLSGGAARILRPGAITAEQVASALGQPAASAGPAGDSPPRVPGSLEQHYAPRAAVVALEQDAAGAALASALLQAGRTALIAPRGWLARQAFAPGATLVALPDSLDGQAQGLYAALRTADAVSDLIGVVLPPAQGIGVAIRDRVLRAAGRGGASDAGP